MTSLTARPPSAAPPSADPPGTDPRSADPPGDGRPAARVPAPPTWPLMVMTAGYPVLWAVGLGPLAFPVVTGAGLLWLIRHRRPVLVPLSGGIWLLYLGWLLFGLALLDLAAPNTLSGGGGGALLAYAYRYGMYLSGLALMLFLASTTQRELPGERIVNWLGWWFVWTVIGGYVGLALPNGGFTSPVESILPAGLAGNDFIHDLVHPSFAQVQDVLDGGGDARSKAPFTYTNEWGGMAAYLLPFFVLDRMVRPGRRVFGAVVLVLSAVPIVLSLNRGLWICLGAAGVTTLVQVFRRAPLAAMATTLVVLLGLAGVAVTPLGTVFTERVNNDHSNSARGFIAKRAVQGGLDSPVVGWGGPRTAIGNPSSRTLGRSVDCPKCTPPSVGTHGQLWLVVFSSGLVGVALVLGFSLAWLVRLRNPGSALDLVLLITVQTWCIQLFFYPGIPMGLHMLMLAIGLASRRFTPPGRSA